MTTNRLVLVLACSKFLLANMICCFGVEPNGEAKTTRPNVLFIAVDDLRPELGCYGVETVQTPKIDALAKSGVTFGRAYCQLAVCNPSRVSVMTGLRPDSTRVWDLVTRFRDTIPDAVTLPQHLRQHGYYAVSFGKIFHNPWPDDQSWSEPHAWPNKRKLWSDEARRSLAAAKRKMLADGKTKRIVDRLRAVATEEVDLPDDLHIDGAITQQALKAMRRLAKQNQPFFLAAGFVRPHLPFVVPRKYWKLYDPMEIPLASNPQLPSGAPEIAMNTMYELRDYIDFRNTPRPDRGSLTEEQQRRLKHGYYAAVSFIDAQVGLLLAELEKLDLDDQTIVVLWSDHGWKLGEHNSWCKQTNYEIDCRVPLIVRDPNAAGNGEKSDALVELVDLYPTICELAGVPLRRSLEGTSMVPLLSKPNQPWKQAAFSQFRRKNRTVSLMGYSMRTNHYRYVEWQDRRSGSTVETELYDHRSDPHENTNVAGATEHTETIANLSQQMWAMLTKSVSTSRRPPSGLEN